MASAPPHQESGLVPNSDSRGEAAPRPKACILTDTVTFCSEAPAPRSAESGPDAGDRYCRLAVRAAHDRVGDQTQLLLTWC